MTEIQKYLPGARIVRAFNTMSYKFFAEDANRARKDNAPENLAILRRLALNILRTLPHRASLRRKIKRAGWDNAFLMAALSHMR